MQKLLNEYKENMVKNFKKTQKQINGLREGPNKLQNKTKEIIKKQRERERERENKGDSTR
jgi:hypothetical protein